MRVKAVMEELSGEKIDIRVRRLDNTEESYSKAKNKFDITCFSFDGIKNITCGEGGAIISNDKKFH